MTRPRVPESNTTPPADGQTEPGSTSASSSSPAESAGAGGQAPREKSRRARHPELLAMERLDGQLAALPIESAGNVLDWITRQHARRVAAKAATAADRGGPGETSQ